MTIGYPEQRSTRSVAILPWTFDRRGKLYVLVQEREVISGNDKRNKLFLIGETEEAATDKPSLETLVREVEKRTENSLRRSQLVPLSTIDFRLQAPDRSIASRGSLRVFAYRLENDDMLNPTPQEEERAGRFIFVPPAELVSKAGFNRYRKGMSLWEKELKNLEVLEQAVDTFADAQVYSAHTFFQRRIQNLHRRERKIDLENHVWDVFMRVRHIGGNSIDQSVAWLYSLLQRNLVTKNELSSHFGKEITEPVFRLNNSPSIPSESLPQETVLRSVVMVQIADYGLRMEKHLSQLFSQSLSSEEIAHLKSKTVKEYMHMSNALHLSAYSLPYLRPATNQLVAMANNIGQLVESYTTHT